MAHGDQKRPRRSFPRENFISVKVLRADCQFYSSASQKKNTPTLGQTKNSEEVPCNVVRNDNVLCYAVATMRILLSWLGLQCPSHFHMKNHLILQEGELNEGQQVRRGAMEIRSAECTDADEQLEGFSDLCHLKVPASTSVWAGMSRLEEG